jgi:ATP-dependent exoDNAse (exonuclease V) beta subunit
MLESAQDLGAQRNGTVRTFLDWWDRKGHQRSIRVSGGNDAVQIMTPHKAKGLAFPVVIVPVVTSDFTKFKDELPVLLDASEFGLPAALLRDSDLKDTPMNSVREAEIGRTQLDAFNIAYVAMTRAIERLDVLLEFKMQPEQGEAKGLAHALWNAWMSEFSGSFETEDLSVFGKFDRKESDEKQEENALPSQLKPKLLLGQSFQQLVARPKVHWSEPLPEGEMNPRDFGNAVHSVLSEVIVRSDWNNVRDRLSRNASLSEAQRHTIQEAVESILGNEDMRQFFDAPHEEVFAERTLRLADGGVGRPDRVVQIAGISHVIDYKTGKPETKHLKQVKEYCEAVEGISEKRATCGWVVYTSDMRIEQVYP